MKLPKFDKWWEAPLGVPIYTVPKQNWYSELVTYKDRPKYHCSRPAKRWKK